MIQQVGLRVEHLRRYPHSFSGGQRQRIGIARALVVDPQLVIADEPVSALDVSIQAQILNLLKDLQEQNDLTYIFVSHNMAVIRYISDRIAVMYAGKLVELGPKTELLSQPRHPYTELLLAAVPRATDRRTRPPHAHGGRTARPGAPAVRLCLPHALPPMPASGAPRKSPHCVRSNPAIYVSCHFAEELTLQGVAITCQGSRAVERGRRLSIRR